MNGRYVEAPNDHVSNVAERTIWASVRVAARSPTHPAADIAVKVSEPWQGQDEQRGSSRLRV
jgi:hypothetical protein